MDTGGCAARMGRRRLSIWAGRPWLLRRIAGCLEARAVLLATSRVPAERRGEAATWRGRRRHSATVGVRCPPDLAHRHMPWRGVTGGGGPARRTTAEWRLATTRASETTADRHRLLPMEALRKESLGRSLLGYLPDFKRIAEFGHTCCGCIEEVVAGRRYAHRLHETSVSYP